jgi:hypothetical protein
VCWNGRRPLLSDPPGDARTTAINFLSHRACAAGDSWIDACSARMAAHASAYPGVLFFLFTVGLCCPFRALTMRIMSPAKQCIRSAVESDAMSNPGTLHSSGKPQCWPVRSTIWSNCRSAGSRCCPGSRHPHVVLASANNNMRFTSSWSVAITTGGGGFSMHGSPNAGLDRSG